MSYRLPILYLDLCIPSILTWYQNFMQGCFSSKKGSKGSHIPKFGVSCSCQNWMYGNRVRPCNFMTKQESIVSFISIIFDATFYFSFLLVLCIQISLPMRKMGIYLSNISSFYLMYDLER